MRLKSFKYGSGVTFEHKGSWEKTYIEVEVELDESDDSADAIAKTKAFVNKEIQKEIDNIIGE